MISAARLQASRLIVMLFGSRQRMFMMLRTCFGSSVAMVVAAQSRKRCTHRCFPKAARVCFATRRGITLYVSGVPVWEIQTASQSRRCSTPPSREQDRSVVIEVSIEVSDLGSRDAGFDRLAPLYLATIEMQTITGGLANKVTPGSSSQDWSGAKDGGPRRRSSNRPGIISRASGAAWSPRLPQRASGLCRASRASAVGRIRVFLSRTGTLRDCNAL